MTLTTQSYAVLSALASDSGNWNGSPLISQALGGMDITKARGNLSDLVQKGMILIASDEGNEYAELTEYGREFCDANGIDWA